MKQQDIKTIDIQAKEWFDKVNGNSYFAALVTLNFGMPGEKQIKLPFQYGYGNQYEQETLAELQEQLILPYFDEGNHITLLWKWCKDNNVIYRHSKQTNCKKSELKNI